MKRLLLIPILFWASCSFGQIVDQFNYATTLDATGWVSHGGAAGQITPSPTASDDGNSLSFSGFQASVGNRILLVAGNNQDVNKALTGITGTGYYSLLLKVTNTTGMNASGDYFAGFGINNLSSLTTFAARLFVKPGSVANTFKLGIQNYTGGTPTQTYGAADYPVGTTVLVVVKFNTTTSPYTASLFVNPVPGAAEPASIASNNSGTTTNFTTFGSLFLRQGGSLPSTTGNLEIDEIRAGSTWASVTPTGAVSCNTTNTINVSRCETYTVPSGHETHTTSGVYHDTIPNAGGCDSLLTINLTIKHNTTSTISPIACGTYTVPSGHESYTTSGTYHDTIPNAAGCDSLITINLTITGSITYYQDLDLDGFGNPNVSQPGCAPITNYVTNNDDCDDTNPAITTGTTYYADTDGDGLGDPATAVVECTPPTNHVTNNTDCDDTNPAIGAAVLYYVDTDSDGYGSASATGVPSCTVIGGSVTNNTDCNDNNPAVHPGATEIPNNGIDEDCNGSDLNTLGTALGMYQFTNHTCALPVDTATSVQANISFSSFNATGDSLECVDAAGVLNYKGFNTAATIDATEYYHFAVTPANCYGMDLNLIKFNHRLSGTGGTPTLRVRSSLDNYTTDLFTKQLAVNGSTYMLDTVHLTSAFDNVTSTVEFRFYITNMGQSGTTYRYDNVTVIGSTNTLPTQTYYADADGDTYGNPAVSQTACTAPNGYVLDNTDCDDTDAEEFPGAVWYADTDGDGFGDAGSSQISCTRPTGHVSNDNDCNDTDAQIGSIVLYYVDADGDGFGDADATAVNSCTPIAGSVTNNDDCDDDDDEMNPGATEVCDGVDNNCDGDTDEGFTMVTYYEDADGDTYGNPLSPLTDCAQPIGYVTNDDDCNDTIAAIHPGAVDQTGNGIDENCDGVDGVLGIEESILADLNVYPNPGTSSVVLSLTSGWNGFNVTFAGVDGKEIALTSTQKSADTLEFNTETLVSGTYFIRLTSASGTALVRWVKN